MAEDVLMLGRSGASRGLTVVLALLLLGAVGALAWAALAPWAEERPARLTLASTLGGADTAGYARATEPRPFTFPGDHGPHPDFRTEWWYVTANLETADGRRFGMQLTLFRSALAPPPGAGEAGGERSDAGEGGEGRAETAQVGGERSEAGEGGQGRPGPGEGRADGEARASAWATRQAWMGHFALTDVEAGEFHAFERFGRGAVGLAGARLAPFRVWVEDWEIREEDVGGGEARRRETVGRPAREVESRAGGDRRREAPPESEAELDRSVARDEGSSGASGVGPPRADEDADEVFPLRLRAAAEGIAVDLVLHRGKPPVPQGEAGLDRKGPEPGNASYYYSLTRMPAAGEVRVGDEVHRVDGLAWLDREWSTSALGPDQVGWDWFALQLSDGRELMYYRLRRADGSEDPFSGGVLVGPEGDVRPQSPADVDLEATGRWTSPLDGAAYPSGWRLRVPQAGLDLAVEPLLRDQELDLTFRYWEGAVRVEGMGPARGLRGSGYVELTGYGGETISGRGGDGALSGRAAPSPAGRDP